MAAVKNPIFEKAVRDSFAAQPMMATIGARLSHVAAGEVDIRLPWRAELTQQHGFLHAGAVASALDSACGYAAFSLMPAGSGVLTIEYKLNLLAPAKDEELIARAGDPHRRTITVCRAEGSMLDNGKETTVAIMTATVMTIVDRPQIVGERGPGGARPLRYQTVRRSDGPTVRRSDGPTVSAAPASRRPLQSTHPRPVRPPPSRLRNLSADDTRSLPGRARPRRPGRSAGW